MGDDLVLGVVNIFVVVGIFVFAVVVNDAKVSGNGEILPTTVGVSDSSVLSSENEGIRKSSSVSSSYENFFFRNKTELRMIIPLIINPTILPILGPAELFILEYVELLLIDKWLRCFSLIAVTTWIFNPSAELIITVAVSSFI